MGHLMRILERFRRVATLSYLRQLYNLSYKIKLANLCYILYQFLHNGCPIIVFA